MIETVLTLDDVDAPGAPVPPPHASLHAPMVARNDIPGLGNFARIAPGLFRGAQPTRAGFNLLQQAGVKTIVNLRTSRKDLALVKTFAFEYYHVRCRAWWPSTARIAEILSILKEAPPPIFIHCLHGSDRTGLVVAAYRIVEQGWTREAALDELRGFGFHAKIFPQIGAYLRRFNEAKVRARMESMPHRPKPVLKAHGKA
jgi:protein tyrosine/serine phosphatase